MSNFQQIKHPDSDRKFKQKYEYVKDLSSIESDQSSLNTISKISNPPEILVKMKKVELRL